MQALVRIASSWPERWCTPQSLAPAMKQAGTAMVQPENSLSSAEYVGVVPTRYDCRPPWNPVRAYSALYTRSSSSRSHRHAATSSADGISGATVSAMPWLRSIT